MRALYRKLPGFDNKINRMVADMADHIHGPAQKTRGWISVEPADRNDPLDAATGTGWHAFLYGRTPEGAQFKLPVIPDEHNLRASKLVRPTDTPHRFRQFAEAQAAANHELAGFIAYLEANR